MSGNVTTRSYFTGELAKTRLLDAMYFGLQQRFIYYLFGGELEKISKAFAKQVMTVENVSPIHLYPTFFEMLSRDEYSVFRASVLEPLVRVHKAMGIRPEGNLSPEMLKGFTI